MAFEAVLLEDAGDAVMPCDIGGGGFGRGIVGFKFAAGCGGRGDFGAAVIEYGIDGIDEELIAGLVECGANSVLIIDSAVVEDGAFGIEEDDIGGGCGIKECGEAFVVVGRVDGIWVESGSGVLHICVLVGGNAVDEDEGDGFVGITFGDVGESGEVFAAERAGGAGEGDDRGGVFAVIGEFVGLSGEVSEVEVGDEAADESFGGVEWMGGASDIGGVIRGGGGSGRLRIAGGC